MMMMMTMITIVTEDNDCRYRSRPNNNLDQFCQSWKNYLSLIQYMGLSIRQWIDIPGPLCEIGKCAYYVTSHPLLRYRVVPLLIGPKWWRILEARIHGIPMPVPLKKKIRWYTLESWLVTPSPLTRFRREDILLHNFNNIYRVDIIASSR